uniref:NADH-ubiquinone oxidoreductase chain 2 n=1 Tax=Heterosternuta allegheniana TaxID=2714604 RepID=A0A894JQH1_9DYTI|nr:NADH dehydrogenase subunit 2 [Heterosternuta allegheniana]
MIMIYKLIFIITLMLGTIITTSSYSWLGTWMGLEINLLSFIPLINMKNNLYSSEASIKYFLIQALASSIFLFSIIMIISKTKMMNETSYLNYMFLMMMNSAILLKLGAAPFHFWFPEIIEGLNWMNSLILMTWQKIAPMMILSYSMKLNFYLFFIIAMSSLIGSIGGLNQISIRKILAFSSINHISWMLSSFIINEMTWIMYFLTYSFISISIVLMFNKFNIFMMKHLFTMMNNLNMMKYFMLINLLSLGGLPPFLGFLPKWIIIQNLSLNNYLMISFMIFMTLITLFFYIRISYSSMLIYNNELNFYWNMNMLNYNNLMINMMTFISTNGLIIYTIMINFY